VPQGIEVHRGAPIVYSLGNFIFYQDTTAIFRRRGYLLELGLKGQELSGFVLHPYVIGEEGLNQLQGDEQRAFWADLRAVSEPLSTPNGTLTLWHAYLDARGATFWREACGGLVDLVAQTGLDSHTAAKLRNHFITPAHRYFMVDGLTRLIDGTLGDAPAWAVELVDRWSR
jgi:hypothetical protein